MTVGCSSWLLLNHIKLDIYESELNIKTRSFTFYSLCAKQIKFLAVSNQASTEIEEFLVSYYPLTSSQVRSQFLKDRHQPIALETLALPDLCSSSCLVLRDKWEPFNFLAPFFCFISSIKKLFSAEALTGVKENTLMCYSGYVYFPTVSFFFWGCAWCSLHAYPSANSSGLTLSNSDSENNALTERETAIDPELSLVYPTSSQFSKYLTFFFSRWKISEQL